MMNHRLGINQITAHVGRAVPGSFPPKRVVLQNAEDFEVVFLEYRQDMVITLKIKLALVRFEVRPEEIHTDKTDARLRYELGVPFDLSVVAIKMAVPIMVPREKGEKAVRAGNIQGVLHGMGAAWNGYLGEHERVPK